jgi:hypothetical protein
MPQPNQEPTSLFIFRLFVSIIFVVALSSAMGLIYGPLNIPFSFALGLGASVILRVLLEKQILYAYWWLRVWWELKVKSNDS